MIMQKPPSFLVGKVLMLAVLLSLPAIGYTAMVTKQFDTRELAKARAVYKKDLAARDKALGELLVAVEKTAGSTKKQSRSSAALNNLSAAIRDYQKRAGKGGTGDFSSSDIKKIGIYLDEFYAVAAPYEANAVASAVRELGNSQNRAKQSFNFMLRAWQQSLTRATGAKTGDRVVIAKRPSAGKRSVDAEDSSASTASEEITIQSSVTVIEPAQSQIIQPVIEVTYLDDGFDITEPQSLPARPTAQTVPSGTVRPQNMQPVTLVLVNSNDSPTIDLFEFAEQTGSFEDIVVSTQPDTACAEAIARENASRGYSLLFSATGDDAECVSTSRNNASDQNCRVCFYEHMNYGGDYYCTDEASGDLRDHDMNDKVTSVRFFKSHCPSAGVNLFEHSDNGGRRLALAENSRNIGDTYNDKATTFTFSRAMGSNIADSANCYAKLFEHSGYQGKSVQLDPAMTEIEHLRRHGMNDKTTSILIDFRGCPNAILYVYKDDNYGGTRWSYTRSSRNIGEERNDEITGARLVVGR